MLALAALLASCATDPSPRTAGSGTYKVGTPYQIGGVWYYPKEDPFYDETGIASWYGHDFHGKLTANGEQYNMDALTAAHRTLPLPTIVRVTNLENGKSLRLRVNDRGPYARGRIIDVSRRASELLGFQRNGTARVRVEYEGRGKVADPTQSADLDPNHAPASPVRAAPLSNVAATDLAPPPGAQAAVPAATTSSLPVPTAAASTAAPTDNEPDGIVSTEQVPAVTRLWVQVGSFTSRQNADRLVANLSRVGVAQSSRVLLNGKPMFRVRFGPFNAVEEADSMLDKVISAGQNGAQIIVE
jgi:rare lipoprotein A